MDRSDIMRRVRSTNTKPEMRVRRLLTAMGYRYRLHRKDIPGNPDIAFIGRKKVIFVHGCFWHGHDCRRGARVPKNNQAYWLQKIARNRARDKENQAQMQREGWCFLVLWECELQNSDLLRKTLENFLA